ncbi:MAG: hypothetical protein LBP79_04540 [Clostridiales bacterium]|nr:hypothetical protein [Clostridiales bacterium]
MLNEELKIPENIKNVDAEKDIPRWTAKDSSSRLTSDQKVDVVKSFIDKDSHDKERHVALIMFFTLCALLIMTVIISSVFHSRNYPEMQLLSGIITFVQAAVTTIIGYLFGTRAVK